MKKILLMVTVLVSNALSAQNYFEEGISCFEAKSRMSDVNLKKSKVAFPGDGNIDVKYYFLDLKIDPSTKKNISGAVRIDFLPLVASLKEVSLDLSNAYTVDSIVAKKQKLTYSHAASTLKVELKTAASNSEVSSLMVYYHGTPPVSENNFSLQFSTHGGGQPVIWTLSEPYDAPLWWPCVDNPADKADSCDVWITLPNFYTAVSQGILEELKINADGTNTAKWKHRYPISQYLISIAASNYVLLESTYVNAEDKEMPVLNYVYLEIANDTRLKPLLDETVEMLDVFSESFGEYPFVKEKYGHAMFGFGGGMEHQTISSMGGFSASLIGHELAHQWFGDNVTCKSWRDIWINEGFAEWASIYFFEKSSTRTSATYKRLIEEAMEGAKFAVGSVAIENTSSVNAIFNFSKTYQKGSMVVHMLRGVLGDEVFFATLKEFQNTEFAYGNASIEDFKSVAESVSGLDLTYFFDQWLFGDGYPKYNFGWHQSIDKSLKISVMHSGSNTVKTFKMPMEIKISYANGNSLIKKVFVDANELVFEFDDLTEAVLSVELDPNNHILKDVSEVDFSNVLSTNELYDLKIYPNPTFDKLNLNGVLNQDFQYELLNSLGQNLSEGAWDGNGLNVKYLPAGRYFIKFKDATNKVFVKSFIKN